MADELIDILSEDASPTGEVNLKSIAHKKGLWHASVHIWLYTPDGEILIQKRTVSKDTYPNLWDISVAGHLGAGDTPISAALRETKEEIGLVISAEALLFLKTIKNSKQPNETIIDNEYNHLFIYCTPIIIDQLKLQAEEVSEVRLLTLNEFQKELTDNYSKFVPHSMEYYAYIISNIKRSLSIK